MNEEDKIKIKNVIDSITDEQLKKALEIVTPCQVVQQSFIKLLCDKQTFEYYANNLFKRMRGIEE